MSVNLTTPSLLKRKIFRNESYDVIIFDYGATKKVLSRDSDDIVDLVLRPKFGNSSVSVREVIIISILWESDQKNHFLMDGLGSSSIIRDWH